MVSAGCAEATATPNDTAKRAKRDFMTKGWLRRDASDATDTPAASFLGFPDKIPISQALNIHVKRSAGKKCRPTRVLVAASASEWGNDRPHIVATSVSEWNRDRALLTSKGNEKRVFVAANASEWMTIARF